MCIRDRPDIDKNSKYSTLSIVISPDNKLVAVAGEYETIYLIESDTYVIKGKIKSKGVKNSLAFSNDGKYLVYASSDKHSGVINLANFSLLHQLEKHTESVRDVSFIGNTLKFASVGKDGVLNIWNASTGILIATHSYNHPAERVDASKNGRFIAVAYSNKKIRIYDSEELSLIKEITEPVKEFFTLKFHPDSERLLFGGKGFSVYKMNLLNTKEPVKLFGDFSYKGMVSSISTTREGKYVVVSSRDGILRIYEQVNFNVESQINTESKD
ncbi:MAG: hypothetical protein IAE91_11560 [Ignavibacteriaceae bacterium]|nr:hypothetical protein [Ignavibacteriaceae bacterium]